jgi:hypothetical protein
MALVILCSLFFSNCDLERDENFYFVNLEITDADVPDFFVLNQSHNMEVTFSRPDGCTYFQGFDVFSDENGMTTVVAIGSVLTDEECTSTQESLTGILTITAQDVEFYTLRFYSGEDAEGNIQYLEHRVPVVNGINP